MAIKTQNFDMITLLIHAILTSSILCSIIDVSNKISDVKLIYIDCLSNTNDCVINKIESCDVVTKSTTPDLNTFRTYQFINNIGDTVSYEVKSYNSLTFYKGIENKMSFNNINIKYQPGIYNNVSFSYGYGLMFVPNNECLDGLCVWEILEDSNKIVFLFNPTQNFIIENFVTSSKQTLINSISKLEKTGVEVNLNCTESLKMRQANLVIPTQVSTLSIISMTLISISLILVFCKVCLYYDRKEIGYDSLN